MNELNRLLKGLLDDGLIFEKEVKNCTPTSGAIYLPKKYIGRKLRVILLPENNVIETFNDRLTDAEATIKLYARLIEIISGRKIRTLLEANKEEVEKIREEIRLNNEDENEEEEDLEEIETLENPIESVPKPVTTNEEQPNLIKIDLNKKE